MYAYKCTTNSATGYSPHNFLFGGKPRSPIDIILPTDASAVQDYPEYVDKWQLQMKEAYDIAPKHSSKRKKADSKRRNEQRPMLCTLEIGDRVLIRNMSPRDGPYELRPHWEDDIAIVASRIGKSAQKHALAM